MTLSTFAKLSEQLETEKNHSKALKSDIKHLRKMLREFPTHDKIYDNISLDVMTEEHFDNIVNEHYEKRQQARIQKGVPIYVVDKIDGILWHQLGQALIVPVSRCILLSDRDLNDKYGGGNWFKYMDHYEALYNEFQQLSSTEIEYIIKHSTNVVGSIYRVSNEQEVLPLPKVSEPLRYTRIGGGRWFDHYMNMVQEPNEINSKW